MYDEFRHSKLDILPDGVTPYDLLHWAKVLELQEGRETKLIHTLKYLANILKDDERSDDEG